MGVLSERNPSVDILHRPRLLEAIAARWNHRVVVVEAPGGFGKSTLLNQAMADNTQDPLGTDVLWRVGFNDVGPQRILDRLFNGVATSLGQPTVQVPGRAAFDDLLLAQSPRRVCLIIDNAHRLESDEQTITSLVDELPLNVSFVLSGRPMPWLPLVLQEARGEMMRIDQRTLAFDNREIDEYADRSGIDVETLRQQGGWPVLAVLSQSGRAGATTDFLFKEIVSELDVDIRRSLIAATCVDGASEKMLAAVRGASGSEVVDNVALSRIEDERLRVHNLWWDARENVFDAGEFHDVALQVFAWLRDQDAPIDAALLALEIDEVDQAREAVLDSAFVGERFLNPPIIGRLLNRFAGHAEDDDPVVTLLRVLLVRADPEELDNALRLYGEAVERFRAEENLRGEAAAWLGLIDVRWTRGDAIETFSEILERLIELRALGVAALDPLEQILPVVLHDLSGEFNQALLACQSLDTSRLSPIWANAMDIWTTTLAGLCGRLDQGLSVIEEVYERTRSDLSLFGLIRATFLAGDPSRALTLRKTGHRLSVPHNDSYDEVQVASTGAIIAASWGEHTPMSELAFGPPRTREIAYEAIGRAASRVAAHDEPGAVAEIAALLEQTGTADVMSLGEIRRWLPYGYVLSETLRALFDTEAESALLGPDHQSRWEIAHDLVAMRKGKSPTHEHPSAELLFCTLPLAWSIDYVLHLRSYDVDASSELQLGLERLVGGTVADELRYVAQSDHPRASDAFGILRAAPALPVVASKIRTGQSCEVIMGERSSVVPTTPARVLQALALRGSMSRAELAAAIWGQSSQDKAAASLRVALSSLRKLLEPERAKGEPSFHLRADERSVTLHSSSHLTVDVWTLQTHVDEGRAHEAAGRSRSAAGSYAQILDEWDLDICAALRDTEAFEFDVERFDTELAEAVVRYSELALSLAEPMAARRAAMRVLLSERFEERAYRVLIRAALQEGDRAEARRQADLCMTWFNRLGISPTADTTLAIQLTQ